MKSHPRIQRLETTHVDKGSEQLPRTDNWQLRVVRFLFPIVGRIFPKFTARFAYKIFATPRWRAQHRQPDDLILSAQVIDFPFQNETIKLYEWHTEGATQGTILLAHGWESRGTALRMYVNPLREKGFNVVAFDGLAHGNSSGKINNLYLNGHTIAALAQHYGGFHAVIGHSFGCSSTVFAQAFVDNTFSLERLVFLAVPHHTRFIMDSFLKFIHAPPSVQTAFLDGIKERTGQNADDIDVARLVPPSVKVGKLLLIHDEKDKIATLNAAERIVEAWDNSLLLVTSGFGHFRVVKNPDVIRRVVDFITN